jgi:hypothetical protein
MSRDQEVPFEQDRLGNERRKLDTLRAREGFEGVDDESGLVEIGSAETSSAPTDTSSIQIAYSLPTHTDQAILEEAHAYNGGSVSGTYSIWELELDNTGSITTQTRRSVPVEVVSAATRINSMHGKPFEGAIGVSAEFEGFVAVGVIADHDQSSEPSTVQTE